MKVLVVEDDPAVRISLVRGLAFEGYEVTQAADGVAGLDAVAAQTPDVVVLDLGLPRLGGLEMTRRIRAGGNRVPILMLTARGDTADRVAGLDAGADDYLPKPFALDELYARLRALLRRTDLTDHRVLQAGDLRMDLATRRVSRAGAEIELSRTEFSLLEFLLRHPDQVMTRPQILNEVWGFAAEGQSNSLDVYIGYLRRKTEAGGRPRIVHTVRGVGYVARPPTEPQDGTSSGHR